jgi:hypothetical protein
MSNPAATVLHGTHGEPAPQENENTPVKDELEESAQKQQENFQQETPDAEALSSLIQLLAGTSFIPLSKRFEVIDAFEKLNGKNFARDILKLDPEQFNKLQTAHETASREINRQTAQIKKGKTATEVKVGNWRFQRSMTLEQWQRRDYAMRVAQGFQNNVRTGDINKKMQSTVRVLGLSDENAKKLQDGLPQWMEKHPGKNTDAYFIEKGTALNRIQNNNGKPLKGEKVLQKGIQNELDLAHRKNLEEHVALKKEVRQVVQNALDPAIPPPSAQKQKEEMERIFPTSQKAQQPAPVQVTITQPQTAPPQPVQQQAAAQTPSATLPVQTPSIPSVPSIPKSIPGVSNLQTKVLTVIRNSALIGAMRRVLARTLMSLRHISKPLAKFTLGFAKKALPFMFRAGATAVKTAVTATAVAASAGTTLALTAAYEAVKKIPFVGQIVEGAENVVWGGLKMGAEAVVLVVVAIFVGAFFLLSSPSTFPIFSAADAKSVAMTDDKTIGWKLFEDTYLSRVGEKEKTLSWSQFEQQLLTASEKQLSQK